jgi:predicted nucleotidyltransferase
MSAPLDISQEHRSLLLGLLREHLPGTRVWAYGSRVNGSGRPASDLDLVAFTTRDQGSRVSNLREALEESSLPFVVDLHVWSEMPDSFRRIIRERFAELQAGPDVDTPSISGDPAA